MTPSLDAVCRFDWRFLLPDAQPRLVTILDDADDPSTNDGAELVGVEMVRPGEAPAGRVDVVVVRSSADSMLQRAVALRAPDGVLVVEAGSPISRHKVARRLRNAGLDVHHYGCWPTVATATRFVPLGDRAQMLGSAQAAKNRRRRNVATLLTRAGLGALVFRQSWSVATADGRPHAPSPLRVASGDDGVETGSMTLLTPRFGTSRHVIALVVGDSGEMRVAKTSRIPGDDEQLASEARGLTSISGPRPLRPSLLTDTKRFGQRWVVQTGIEGQALTRRDVAADPDRWLAAAGGWLADMPRGERSAPDRDGRRSRLLDPALELLARCADLAPELRPLADDAERAVDRVAGLALPVCAEHGDFRPPNLVVTSTGALAAVDWELAEPNGFPLHDLAFFHMFVTDVVPHVGARLTEHAATASRRDELDPDLVAPLTTLCALRQIAHVVDRRSDTVEELAAGLAGSDVARAWFVRLGARASTSVRGVPR